MRVGKGNGYNRASCIRFNQHATTANMLYFCALLGEGAYIQISDDIFWDKLADSLGCDNAESRSAPRGASLSFWLRGHIDPRPELWPSIRQ